MFLTGKEYQKLYPNEGLAKDFCTGDHWYLKEGMLEWGNDAIHLAGPFSGGFAHVWISDEKVLHPLYNNPGWKLYSDKKQYEFALISARKEKETSSSPYIAKMPLKKLAQQYFNERPTIERHIRFWILGTDDSSWTRYFTSKEKAFELLDLFSECPPTITDIENFGFFFSN
jgi:hypothetical protein